MHWMTHLKGHLKAIGRNCQIEGKTYSKLLQPMRYLAQVTTLYGTLGQTEECIGNKYKMHQLQNVFLYPGFLLTNMYRIKDPFNYNANFKLYVVLSFTHISCDFNVCKYM